MQSIYPKSVYRTWSYIYIYTGIVSSLSYVFIIGMSLFLFPHSDLNLISWSSSNLLAVPLGNRMYIWNASTGDINQLMELSDAEHICSASWVKEGSYLAVGTSNGEVQVCLTDNLLPFLASVLFACLLVYTTVTYFTWYRFGTRLLKQNCGLCMDMNHGLVVSLGTSTYSAGRDTRQTTHIIHCLISHCYYCTHGYSYTRLILLLLVYRIHQFGLSSPSKCFPSPELQLLVTSNSCWNTNSNAFCITMWYHQSNISVYQLIKLVNEDQYWQYSILKLNSPLPFTSQ